MKHTKTYDEFLSEGFNVNEPTYDPATGLIYYFNVPFTKEDIEDILEASKTMLRSKYTSNKQFEVQPMLFVKDKVNGGEHTYSIAQIGILGSFYQKNKDRVAARKDFY